MALVALVGFVLTGMFFGVAASLTRASKREIIASLVGGQLAGLLEIPVDAAGAWLGLWHYPGRPSFGPVVFYPIAGIGCAALGLIAWRLARSRFKWRGVLVLFAVLGIYGPIRDRLAGRAFDLFYLSAGWVPHVMDALFIWIVPTGLVWAVIELKKSPEMPRMNL